MSLADYLAKNYLAKDSSLKLEKKKKRKRKDKDNKDAGAGIVIADDDILGWDDTQNNEDEDTDETPILDRTYATFEFRKSKTQNWIIANPEPEQSESERKRSSTVEGEKDPKSKTIKTKSKDSASGKDEVEGEEAHKRKQYDQLMSNGTKAGLQTGDQVAAAVTAKRKSELSALLSTSKVTEETIYRDASGRIVNIAMARSEARRKAQEEESKILSQLEKNKGEVQLLETQKRKEQLASAKYMSVARYKDDEEMNLELKEKELWNDPAAGFLTKKKGGKTSVTGKPLYQGSYPPNRYGIRPGYRWDGVDRSNGFEKKWFASRNRKREVKELEYAWEMDE